MTPLQLFYFIATNPVIKWTIYASVSGNYNLSKDLHVNASIMGGEEGMVGIFRERLRRYESHSS